VVANGNETEVPPTMTYSSVVSRDSVHIAFLIAALNNLKLLSCDIQNACKTADCCKHIYCIAGPEFGSDFGIDYDYQESTIQIKDIWSSFQSTSCRNTIWAELFSNEGRLGCMDQARH
jgi:hypothetical protein